jgi:hypothetical protein
MKISELEKPEKYVGLYIVDFGEYTSVGFTALEVAELLESEKYKDCKVYKIHRAYPDGQLEIKGVPSEKFQLETGMFFYSSDMETSQRDFKALVKLSVETMPPSRAKVHLAKYSDDKYVTAIIYPAEFDDEFSNWLLDGKYKTSGPAEGGVEATQRYYDQQPEILDRHQLFGQSEDISRTGEELLQNLKAAVQR